jgi:hypothetical protein
LTLMHMVEFIIHSKMCKTWGYEAFGGGALERINR